MRLSQVQINLLIITLQSYSSVHLFGGKVTGPVSLLTNITAKKKQKH